MIQVYSPPQSISNVNQQQHILHQPKRYTAWTDISSQIKSPIPLSKAFLPSHPRSNLSHSNHHPSWMVAWILGSLISHRTHLTRIPPQRMVVMKYIDRNYLEPCFKCRILIDSYSSVSDHQATTSEDSDDTFHANVRINEVTKALKFSNESPIV